MTVWALNVVGGPHCGWDGVTRRDAPPETLTLKVAAGCVRATSVPPGTPGAVTHERVATDLRRERATYQPVRPPRRPKSILRGGAA